MENQTDAYKRAAGEAAVDRFVRDGMCVGLGTGSTAVWAIRRVGELVAAGAAIVAVPTSGATETLCNELGIPLVPFLARPIAVAIDGADEVAPDFSLTKGGGGALFREKSVALAAERFVVIVDESKLVRYLGRFPTPVEVVPFALPWVRRQIERSFPGIALNERGGERGYRTDNGNAILDCTFGELASPRELDARLRTINGVVATGLFAGLATDVIVAGKDGIRDLQPAHTA
ncbi:MAG: ribose 5-phosphate isomerase A [Candidatus Velthaea sp.]